MGSGLTAGYACVEFRRGFEEREEDEGWFTLDLPRCDETTLVL